MQVYLISRKSVGRCMLSIGTTEAIILYVRSYIYIFEYAPGPVFYSCFFFYART